MSLLELIPENFPKKLFYACTVRKKFTHCSRFCFWFRIKLYCYPKLAKFREFPFPGTEIFREFPNPSHCRPLLLPIKPQPSFWLFCIFVRKIICIEFEYHEMPEVPNLLFFFSQPQNDFSLHQP